ncbi:MAG: hypothetical protein JNK82_15370, partial [Myxococcaceae bacterium]|nr:hypothetical protein [Myxococcaceae bacterium]
MGPLLGIALRVAAADAGLSLIELEDVVALHDAELAVCRRPKTSGTATVEVVVAGDGGVRSVSVVRDSTPASAACFAEQLLGWEFPLRERDTTARVEWPKARTGSRDAGLSQETLRAFQRSQRGVVSQCWLEARKAARDVGRLETRLVFSRTGAVLSATTSGDGGTPMGAASLCVAEAARDWRLEPAAQPTVTTFKWLVAPSHNRLRASAAADEVVVTEAETTQPTRPETELDRQMIAASLGFSPCLAKLPPNEADAFVRLGFHQA